jgi:two-component sensor histidine kinase
MFADRKLLAIRSERAFNAVVVGAVALGFLTLVGVGLLGAIVMNENLGFTSQVAHTYQVEGAISDFRILDERTETARRGYLLSHDESFDQAVRQTATQLSRAILRIQLLTADNPQQQANIARLRPLVFTQQQAISVSMAFARDGHSDTSQFYRDAGVGASRAIRQLTDQMVHEEEQKLAIRDLRREATIAQLFRIAIAAGGLAVFLAVGSVWVILRYTRQLSVSRAELAELNAGLEDQVVTRTADLEAAKAELVAGNQRLEALLREVNHRVANSLQLVSAFVQMQASALDGAARTALKDTQRRIEAITQVHRRLYSAQDVESVDMNDYLGALVRELEDTLSSTAAPRTLSLVSDPVRLATDKAVSVGVIVNELITNACKYAYRRGQAGEVRVRLTDEGAGLTLTVEDDGVGMAADGVVHGTGLGGRLIKAMATSLESEVLYDRAHSGVRATLRLPTA